MRSAMVCAGIVVALLATACGKSQDDAALAKPLPVPQCKAAGNYDAKNFESLVLAMDRSGEIAAVTQRFLQYRKTIDALLADRSPELQQRLKPVLDAQFSEAVLRARTACLFAPMSADRKGVAALVAWSRSPEMRAINAGIWNHAPPPSEEDDVKMTPSRMALLRNVSDAMALQQIQAKIDAFDRDVAPGLIAALGPGVSSDNVSTPGTILTAGAIIDKWLTPVLKKIPNDDLEDYLEFVESQYGSDHYVGMVTAYDFKAGEWYAHLFDLLRESSASIQLPGDAAGKDALVADAQQLLWNVGTPAAAADAMNKLLQAERIEPRNPDIQALLGEAAMKAAAAMPLRPDQLRVVIESPNYYQADKYLAKALELAPEHGNAHVQLGRLRFLQGNDDEALRLYERAVVLEPNHPFIEYYLGDLWYTSQDYTLASRYYRSVAAKPERIANMHVNALARLLLASTKGSQLAEYQRVAEAYLKQHPDAWNFRLDYADYLLSKDTAADKVIALIEPVPDDWLAARKFPTLSAALVRKAADKVDKKGEPIGDSMRAMRRAIEISPDPHALAEAICRSGVGGKLAQITTEASRDPRGVATALIVCGLRWQRNDIVSIMDSSAQVGQLSAPHPDLFGDTPLCYAVATKNLRGFVVLAKMQVNPAVKCNDGDMPAERLNKMSYGGDQDVRQMQSVMSRFFRKS
jgi:tetratricopeptide (TPR) repeat protein